MGKEKHYLDPCGQPTERLLDGATHAYPSVAYLILDVKHF
ncbi:hypothetical protein ADICYQ_2754 [Cyclobacterium qasimii M12-11B]|uniref:Uncharacterized protein n=1 Tax=Cyclobacterium qasimii M12-11B TaxID=641524 RepID=S7WNI9_9BACT|nr:hypothetical protein ADICYQ_2754 [Cyclobacterium qasimii M12-11B]